MVSSPIGALGNKTDWARVARGGEDCFIIFMFDHVMNHLTFDNTRPAAREHVISHQIPVISAINSSCSDPVMIYTLPCIPDLTVTVTRKLDVVLWTWIFKQSYSHCALYNIIQVVQTYMFLKRIVFIEKCSYLNYTHQYLFFVTT